MKERSKQRTRGKRAKQRINKHREGAGDGSVVPPSQQSSGSLVEL